MEPTLPAATGSIYRPAPEAPSPRWMETSRWLIRMAKAMWGILIAHLLGSMLFAVANDQLARRVPSDAAFWLMVAGIPDTLAHVVRVMLWLGVCWSLAALPTWVGVRPLARTGIGLATVYFLEPFVVRIVSARHAAHASPSAHHYMFVGLFGLTFYAVLHVLIAMTIDRAAALDRGYSERLLPWALLAVVLRFGALVPSVAIPLLTVISPLLSWLPFVLGAVLSIVFTLGYTRVLRRASVAIGTQSWPEGHRPS